MSLLYKLVVHDPSFLGTLRKFCKRKGINARGYWLLLKALKDVTDEEPIVKWLAQEGLIDLDVWKSGLSVWEVKKDADDT